MDELELRKEIEKDYDNFLKRWFDKWHRRVVNGRCLVELKSFKYNLQKWKAGKKTENERKN